MQWLTARGVSSRVLRSSLWSLHMVLVHFLLTLTTQHMTPGFMRLINSYMYLVQSSKITKAFLDVLVICFLSYTCMCFTLLLML